MSIRINKVAILALFGFVTLAINEVAAKDLETLGTAPAKDAHQVTKVPHSEYEVKITAGMQILENNKDQFGSSFIAQNKNDLTKAREGQKDVQMLLSLISFFGALTLALIFIVIKTVYQEHENEK